MKALTKVQNGTSTSFEIPTATIFSSTVIIAVVNLVANLASSFFFTMPTNKVTTELQSQTFKVQLLQRILENENQIDRANSIKLLISAHLLDDADGSLTRLAKSPKDIPRWNVHPLQTFNGSFEKPKPNSSQVANSMSTREAGD